MNKYSKGKIYMVITENSNDIYVGSTTLTLKKRLQLHESYYRLGQYCSSQEILKQGDYKIILIKKFPCNSLNELEREEGNFQRDLVCVNKRVAGRTGKEWYEDNKDKKKEYYIKNREAVLTHRKEYRIKNREAFRNYDKEHYIKNREAILIKNKEKFNCECGGKYTKGGKVRHFKTKKHQKYQNRDKKVI